MAKVVQVSDEIYDTLMLHKGMMMVVTKKAITFDHVIAYEFNKANHLTQLISRLVRDFPEERERIGKIAKELEVYADVEGILSTIGKTKK